MCHVNLPGCIHVSLPGWLLIIGSKSTNPWDPGPWETPPGHRGAPEIGIFGCFLKIGGNTPKWMVKIMENPIKVDDFGGNTHDFRKQPFVYSLIFCKCNTKVFEFDKFLIPIILVSAVWNWYTSYVYVDVSENMVYTQIIHFNILNRVFHYFHHPFWGCFPLFFGSTPMYMFICSMWHPIKNPPIFTLGRRPSGVARHAPGVWRRPPNCRVVVW